MWKTTENIFRTEPELFTPPICAFLNVVYKITEGNLDFSLQECGESTVTPFTVTDNDYTFVDLCVDTTSIVIHPESGADISITQEDILFAISDNEGILDIQYTPTITDIVRLEFTILC